MTVSSFAITTLFLCAGYQCVLGADAVFSNDGQHIYAVAGYGPEETPQLRHIDLSKRKISLIPLKELSGHLWGVSRSDNEDILCATESALWRYHPSDGTVTKICDLPQTEDWDAADVAYNPKTRTILLSTSLAEPIWTGGLWLLRTGESEPQPVRISWVDGVECPVFDRNGELFFSHRGDLWHGKIAGEAEDQPSPSAYRLVAYRYASLATLETNVGASPSQCGVQSIAVARNFIYVFIRRLGGSGNWRLAQVPRPATKRVKSVSEFDTYLDLPERLSIYRRVLDSTKVLTEETMEFSYLCASADESRVYYTDGDKHWLITNGKRQELHFVESPSPKNETD